MNNYSKLNIINGHYDYDNVTLIEPSTHYYLQIAAQVDTPKTPFFFLESDLKKRTLKICKQFCSDVSSQNQVIEINLFKAILTPPGRSKYVSENKKRIHIAKFDIVILIEFETEKELLAFKNDSLCLELFEYLRENSTHVYQVSASNARRIGDVDHANQGVFLFNYFYAEDVEQNLEIWNYTAGWFEKETGLDNSTLLLPVANNDSDYTVINHCRWNGLLNILPSLIFKRSFNSYVLENFYKNNVGAMPILYKLVK